jgi:hypothetical protein
MLADEFSGTQEGTIHFHYLLPENGGCVRIAATLDEHVRQLSERLRDPEEARAEAQRFVAHFIRPHGLERPATPIFADAIERLAAAPAPAPLPAPAWRYAVRPLILAAAAPEPVVNWARRKDRFAPLRKRAKKMGYRTRKSVGRTWTLTSDRIRRTARLWSRRWQKALINPLRARR